MNEPNTKTRQVAIQTSIALVNDTVGIPRRCPFPACTTAGVPRRRSQHSTQVNRALCRDGEHREDAEGDACRHGLQIDPEGHPGQQDDEQTGQERRQDVGTQTTLQVEIRP